MRRPLTQNKSGGETVSKKLLRKSMALFILLTLGVAACTSANAASGSQEICSGSGDSTVQAAGATVLESGDESAVEILKFDDTTAVKSVTAQATA
jgi:hypothetical protein